MTESFAKLFEESIANVEMSPGSIVKAKVLAIDSDYVTLHAGLKSEGIVPTNEFYNDEGSLEINIGDEVEVALESFEDGFGDTILSREKAKRYAAWRALERAHEESLTITGKIIDKVKGGYTVEVNGIRAFLPGSLVDVRPIKESAYIEGKELDFKVIKMDVKRNNIVVSRRAVIHEENSAERQTLLENMHEGQVVDGIVKNITDYGAFIDLGGIDGLLHITDISWKRVKHPSDVLNIGDEVKVVILRFDRDKNRVSLGMKQIGDDPWSEVIQKYPEGTKLKGKVTNITDYGCFVEIDSGVEGLVHMSEMDWTNKNIHPSKVVELGEEVDVMVLEIDQERRRISLGMKQCKVNPWHDFAEKHDKGQQVSGKIRSITDFGIFIGLDGSIDGLIHLSDISWQKTGEEAVKDYKKGQDVTAVILGIDADRERISLGIKQLEDDPFGNFVSMHDKGSIVTGQVSALEPKHAVVDLAPNVQAHLKVSEISKDRVEDIRAVLNEGDEVEAKIINIDKKNRVINISIKAKDAHEEAEVMKQIRRDNDGAASTSLGDLLKEQIGEKKED